MSTFRRAAALLLTALVPMLGACSDEDPEPARQGQAGQAQPGQDQPGLPPSGRSELVAHFDPKVAPLGLRVARTALVDTGTRRPSPSGRHLALYVEPTSAWSPDRFVTALVPLARTLMPDAFARWPGLESFDICQEPSPGVDDRPEPPPVTAMDITRAASAGIDWEKADLTALFVAALSQPPGLQLRVTQLVSKDPRLTEAEARARALVGRPL